MIAYIEQQGNLLHVRIPSEKSRRPPPGSRGIVTGFSKKSRKRLIEFMCRLKTKAIRGTFLTLTFHYQTSTEEAQKALKRFLMRIRRAYPNVSGIWRREKQPQTGNNHFHLLLFNLPFIPQKKLQRVWTACTGEDRSIIDIRLASGARRIMSYVSKYISKPTDAAEPPSLEDVPYQHAPPEPDMGRCWGWLNKRTLPLGEKFEGFLTKDSTVHRIRQICNDLSRGKASPNMFRITLFSDHSENIFHWIMDMSGLTVQEYKDSKFAPCWEEENADMAIRYSRLLNQ